jgi:hypothetical protein
MAKYGYAFKKQIIVPMVYGEALTTIALVEALNHVGSLIYGYLLPMNFNLLP